MATRKSVTDIMKKTLPSQSTCLNFSTIEVNFGSRLANHGIKMRPETQNGNIR
jgi:hypothetical protein